MTVLTAENGAEPGEAVEEMLLAGGYPTVLLPATPLAGMRPAAMLTVDATAVVEVQPSPFGVEESGRRRRECSGPSLFSPRRPGTGGMEGVGRAVRSTAPWVGLTLLLGWAILGFYAS